MDFKDLVTKRFSARKYTTEAVSDKQLHYLLECARLAPSAVNKQPWKFIVVKSEEAKAKLRETYNRDWFATAPLYIICMKNEHTCWTRAYDQHAHADIDIAIAAEHICLAATECGLGSCWVCNFDTNKMQTYFNADGYEAAVIIPIGHIAPDCPQNEKKRFAHSDIVEYA